MEITKLTRNEKKVLKLLLENARTTDSEIATKLKISSQAVGMIRRKLEQTVIKSYTINLNYDRLGVHTFAIAIARLTQDGLDKGYLEIEELLLHNPHIIQVYRLPKGSSTHIIMYGFNDIDEFDDFFHSPKIRDELHRFLEIQELFTFSHNSLVKNDPNHLLKKVIENFGNPKEKYKFSEIERFKKNL